MPLGWTSEVAAVESNLLSIHNASHVPSMSLMLTQKSTVHSQKSQASFSASVQYSSALRRDRKIVVWCCTLTEKSGW